MIDLAQIKARIVRLEDLAAKLGAEVRRCKAGEGVLSAAEQRQYLDRVQDALAALDAARVTPAAVVKRMTETP